MFLTRIGEEHKLSIEYCQKFLAGKGENFTYEQVREIRNFLYLLAEIELEYQQTEITNLSEKGEMIKNHIINFE